MSINLPLAIAMIIAGTTLGEAIVLMVNQARAQPRMSIPEAEAKGLIPAEKRRPAPAVKPPPKPEPGVTISKVRPR